MGFDTERLIESVRSFPVLWNPEDRGYLDRNKKSNAWEAVAAALNTSDTEAVKKYWKSVRDKYVREKKKVTDSTRSGAGRADVFRPTWAHWPLLSFLGPATRHNSTESNFPESSQQAAELSMSELEPNASVDDQSLDRDSPQLDDGLEEAMGESPEEAQAGNSSATSIADILADPATGTPVRTSQPSAEEIRRRHRELGRQMANEDDYAPDFLPAPQQPKRGSKPKRGGSIDNALDIELLEVAKSMAASTKRPREDGPGNDPFGEEVGAAVKRLPPRIRSVTKIKIMQLLHEAEFGETETE